MTFYGFIFKVLLKITNSCPYQCYCGEVSNSNTATLILAEWPINIIAIIHIFSSPLYADSTEWNAIIVKGLQVYVLTFASLSAVMLAKNGKTKTWATCSFATSKKNVSKMTSKCENKRATLPEVDLDGELWDSSTHYSCSKQQNVRKEQ